MHAKKLVFIRFAQAGARYLPAVKEAVPLRRGGKEQSVRDHRLKRSLFPIDAHGELVIGRHIFHRFIICGQFAVFEFDHVPVRGYRAGFLLQDARAEALRFGACRKTAGDQEHRLQVLCKYRRHPAFARERARAIRIICVRHNIVALTRRGVFILNDIDRRIRGHLRARLRFFRCNGAEQDLDARFFLLDLEGRVAGKLKIQRERFAACKHRAEAAEQEIARAEVEPAQIVPICDGIERYRKPRRLREHPNRKMRHVRRLPFIRSAGYPAAADERKRQAHIPILLGDLNGAEVCILQCTAARDLSLRLEPVDRVGLGRFLRRFPRTSCKSREQKAKDQADRKSFFQKAHCIYSLSGIAAKLPAVALVIYVYELIIA